MSDVHTEPGNSRKKTLGKKRASMAAVIAATPRTPAIAQVSGQLPSDMIQLTTPEHEVPGTNQIGPHSTSAASDAERSEGRESSGNAELVDVASGTDHSTTADAPRGVSKHETEAAATTRAAARPKPAPSISRSAPTSGETPESSSGETAPKPAEASASPARTSRQERSGSPTPVDTRSTYSVSGAPAEDEIDDDESDIVEGDAGHRVSTYIRGDIVRVARKTGLVKAALAIEAIDTALERGVLDALLELRHSGVPPTNSRFPARKQSRRVRARARGATTRVLWQPAFTEDEIKELDKIGNETGAQNRSQLISVAVEWYLGPRHDPRAVDLDS